MHSAATWRQAGRGTYSQQETWKVATPLQSWQPRVLCHEWYDGASSRWNREVWSSAGLCQKPERLFLEERQTGLAAGCESKGRAETSKTWKNKEGLRTGTWLWVWLQIAACDLCAFGLLQCSFLSWHHVWNKIVSKMQSTRTVFQYCFLINAWEITNPLQNSAFFHHSQRVS